MQSEEFILEHLDEQLDLLNIALDMINLPKDIRVKADAFMERIIKNYYELWEID